MDSREINLSYLIKLILQNTQIKSIDLKEFLNDLSLSDLIALVDLHLINLYKKTKPEELTIKNIQNVCSIFLEISKLLYPFYYNPNIIHETDLESFLKIHNINIIERLLNDQNITNIFSVYVNKREKYLIKYNFNDMCTIYQRLYS